MTFLIIMLSLATVCSFIWLSFNRDRLNSSLWFLLIVSILHTLFGVLCVKFFAILEVGFDMSKAGNMSMYGGIFFMPIFYFAYAKLKKLDIGLTFSIFAISIVITYFFARMNCLHEGCCYGKEIGSTGYLYPTRELEIMYYFVFLCIFIPRLLKNKDYKKKKNERSINVYLIFMFSYGIFRFITEFFRYSSSNSIFHIAHLWSAIAIIVSLVLYIISYKRGNINERKQVK